MLDTFKYISSSILNCKQILLLQLAPLYSLVVA